MADNWQIAPSKSARELVYEALREKIVSGDLVHGERLSEVPLSEKLGVSRTPLRDALARLAAEGYLATAEPSGLTVVDPFKDLAELIIRRAALDGVCAHLAALRATDAELAAIQDLSNRYLAGAGLDLADRRLLNQQFHAAITQAAHSVALKAEAENFSLFFRSDRLLQALSVSETAAAIEGHRRIAEAIARRDAFAAETEARAHIYGAYRRHLAPN